MNRKALVYLLTAAVVICMLPIAAFTAEFSDMPNDWSTAALQRAVANGLLTGADGKLMPKDNLTRAQMAVIINRAFGAEERASLNGYTDVAPGAWYYDDMARAVYMKTFVGSGGKLNPDNSITREEVFTVLARAFKLSGSAETSLDKFSDKNKVSAWAKDSIASLVSAGYVAGSDGRLNPQQNITRAEFAQIMDNLLKNYIKTAGTYTEVSEGNVMINVPEVTLKDVTVRGDLIIGDGAGDGNVVLENVKVTGRTVVRGGGVNSVRIIGSSELGRVIISKVDGNVRVFTESGATVELVYIDDGKDDVFVEGKIGSIEISVSNVPVVIQNAQVNNVKVTAPDANLTVGSAAAVNTVSVLQTAQGAAITARTGATITNVNSEAPNTTIGGTGTVKNANIQGDNCTINTIGTKIEVGSEVSGTTSGGQPVPGGTSGTTTSGGGVTTGGGGGSSGGNSSVAVSGVTVSPATMTLIAGGAARTITVTIVPENATSKNVTWSSSNEAVATVDNGVVTPLATGSATITATSAADGTKTAAATVTVVNLAEDPFTPGEGGSLPVITPPVADPDSIGGLFVLVNQKTVDGLELYLEFIPSEDAGESFTLQYSTDGGENWADFDGEFYPDYYGGIYSFWIYPGGSYQYRIVAGDGPKAGLPSNVVEEPQPTLNIFFDGYISVNTYTNGILTGTGLEAEIFAVDPVEWTDLHAFLSCQWFRVDPATYEMTPIEGATGLTYNVTQADAGYYLLIRADGDGINVDGFVQAFAKAMFSGAIIPVIPANEGFITNLSENGFILNLYYNMESLTVDDLVLYDYWGEPITINSVTHLADNAVYYIDASIPMDFSIPWLESNSDNWRLVNEWGDPYLEIPTPAIIDISGLVNGGIVTGGPAVEGFTLDTTSGAEKITVAAGTDIESTYEFTVSNSDHGTLETVELAYSFMDETWAANVVTTELDLAAQTGEGTASQLQAVAGFALDSVAQKVYIDGTVNGIRDKKFYFNVSGGENDGKRYKVYYDGSWKAVLMDAIITTAEIAGPDSVEVKLSGNATETYSAAVKDQNGAAMADETVTWSLETPVSGVSIAANTGVVTVAHTTEAESFTVVATSATDNTIFGEKTVTLTQELSSAKIITGTTIGVLSGGNIDVVPIPTKVSVLKAGLTVSAAATVEILAGPGGDPVADQENTDVTVEMVIEVTAEDGTKAEYTITMATYTIDLVKNYVTGPESIIGETLELPYDPNPALWAPWYEWDHTTMLVEIHRTGTGTITNLQVVSSDPSKFAVLLEHPVNPPGLWTDTLDQNRTETMFYVHAVEGLPGGVHTGSFTVTADNGISESFSVIFRVSES